jgi:hypothetical protein
MLILKLHEGGRAMTQYQKRKAEAREEAIFWQQDFDKHNYTWYELIQWQARFETLAKRYGLIEEFKQNGII